MLALLAARNQRARTADTAFERRSE